MTLTQIKNNFDRAAEKLDEFRFSNYGIHFRWIELRRDGESKSVPAEAVSQQAKELESQRNSQMEKVFPGITRACNCRRFWQFLSLIEGLPRETIEYVASFKNSRDAYIMVDTREIKKNQFYGFWKICRVITNKEGAVVK